MILENQKSLARLLETGFEAMFIFEDGICVEQNKIAEDLFGYSKKESTGKYALDWILNDDRPYVLSRMTSEDTSPYQTRALHKNGSVIVIEVRSRVISHEESLIKIVSALDIGDRQQAINKAREKELVLDTVFDVLPDLFFLMNYDGTILEYRASRQDDLYVPPNTFLQKKMQDVLPAEAGKQFFVEMAKASQSNQLVTFEYELAINDESRIFEARISTVVGNDHLIAIIRDITEQKRIENRMLHQAHYDFLTEIPNRLLALERLDQMIGEAKRSQHQFAVLFIDLDDFKDINDNLGHDIGDQVLKSVANRLTDLVRIEDTVGRLGGDEFVVLLTGVSGKVDVIAFAENILKKFRAPLQLPENNIVISLSIGIAIFPDDANKKVHLLRYADLAMYQSKKKGKGRFTFFSENN